VLISEWSIDGQPRSVFNSTPIVKKVTPTSTTPEERGEEDLLEIKSRVSGEAKDDVPKTTLGDKSGVIEKKLSTAPFSDYNVFDSPPNTKSRAAAGGGKEQAKEEDQITGCCCIIS
jgi:hypothetical protein